MHFKKIANELVFDLTSDEENFINSKYQQFNNNLNKIRNFNLEKYQNEVNELEPLANGTLREDEIYNDFEDSKDVFQNSFSFEDNYVKVNNDK